MFHLMNIHLKKSSNVSKIKQTLLYNKQNTVLSEKKAKNYGKISVRVTTEV